MTTRISENSARILLAENPDTKFSIDVGADDYTISVHGTAFTGILYTCRNTVKTFVKADTAIKCLAELGATNVVVGMRVTTP